MSPRELLGKAELTGFIADAQGVYHDLSKGAFDSYSIKHPGEKHHLSSELFKQPLYKSAVSLAEKAGINLQDYDEMNFKGVARAGAEWLGKRLGIGAGAEGVAAGVATALGAEVSTGGLATVGIIGIAIDAAIEGGIALFAGRAEPQTFLRGDWVLIDEGMKTVALRDKNAADWAMAEALDPTLSELHVLNRKEDYHVGFYVGPGKEELSVTVFDILTGATQEFSAPKVRKLRFDRRVGLDNDQYASEIRELFFAEHDHVLMESEVSCDPGTEVIYKGHLWNIVKCDGDIALLENSIGDRVEAAVAALKRGRQERIGPQYRYKAGEAPVNNGFSVTPGGYGTGDWVWVARNDGEWEAAMVHIISGDNVVLYLTQSGIRSKERISDVRVVDRDTSDTFNRIREFVLFKVAAVEGNSHEAHRLRIRRKYAPIVRQKDPKSRERTWKYVNPKPRFHAAVGKPPVENQAAATALDAAQELQNTLGVPVGGDMYKIMGTEDAECRYRLMEGGADSTLCRKRESGTAYGGFEEPAPFRRTYSERTVAFQPSYVAIGAVCIGAAWYFLR